MVFPSSHFSFPTLFPSPQWVTQASFRNNPVPFGLSYLELDQLQKKLEKNGFRPEPVGTEKCDDGNTIDGDGSKGDGASQDSYRNVMQSSRLKQLLIGGWNLSRGMTSSVSEHLIMLQSLRSVNPNSQYGVLGQLQIQQVMRFRVEVCGEEREPTR